MADTVFYIFAGVAVISAALCILQPNPVAAALWLVSTMFSLAGIYVLLNAQFIAAIQVLVYAGAVMVLFLFVIMLLNLGKASTDLRGPGVIAATVVIAGLLAAELLVLWRYTPGRLALEVTGATGRVPGLTPLPDPALVFPAGQVALQEAATRGVVGSVAVPMFQVYLIPFEITSILLLAAIIGAVVLAKRKV